MSFDKSNIKLNPKKSLGQNFLTDDNIARKIIDSFNINENDIIVEIGSGYGSLTRHLVNKTKKLISIELDKEISEYLSKTYPDIKIINEDFLKINLKEIAGKNKIRILGNIPYNITSPILFSLFDCREAVKDAILMMQLDVAKRLIAEKRTKEYGILSIFSRYYSLPKLLFKIPPTCFYPRPRVDSAMVYFNFEKEIDKEIDNEFFREVVRKSFGKRRKILSNNLKEFELNLNALTIDLNKRAEELDVAEFIELTRQLYRIKHSL